MLGHVATRCYVPVLGGAVNGGVEIGGARYFSASQVAEEIRVSRQTLWRWRKDGKVPAGRLFRDGRVLFTTEEVEAVRTYAIRLEPAVPDTPAKTSRGTVGSPRLHQGGEEHGG